MASAMVSKRRTSSSSIRSRPNLPAQASSTRAIFAAIFRFKEARMSLDAAEVTLLLSEWQKGDSAALERLIPIVYGELRKLADSYLRRERPGHTLQPTALISEAYVRLVSQNTPEFRNRAHFYGVA